MIRVPHRTTPLDTHCLYHTLFRSAGRKNGLSLSVMSLALGMSKTRPFNLLSAEAEHALIKLTIDKEAAVRCLFMPAGYERSATSTIGGTDDMRCVRVREIPRRGQPVSYRHTGFAEPLGQVAGVFGVQRSGEERAYVGRPGVRSEEHTSELQSLMRISYAVFCLKTKTIV